MAEVRLGGELDYPDNWSSSSHKAMGLLSPDYIMLPGGSHIVPPTGVPCQFSLDPLMSLLFSPLVSTGHTSLSQDANPTKACLDQPCL